ncbi:MAG: MarR family transcriptional regulator [Limimaricola sp.]|uniref:MarR family winged helix-turn-helix transcriptional regulator n=1 Tax=Limimaricola sp. TaxID=2211665 RepID=UPI001D23E79C|nr:MarR family transcriptional regulator [Limimaricola sp.]MBI1417772.1 MarR family transcriptional regulator [Limimaricola sp.]
MSKLETAYAGWRRAAEALDAATCAAQGLSPVERRALVQVLDAPCASGELARRVGLTRAGVTALIDRLETRGLVLRQPDPADRRKIYIAPTEGARSLIDTAEEPLRTALARLASEMTKDERKAVTRFLTAMAEATEIANQLAVQPHLE